MKAVVKRSKETISEIVKKAGYSRASYYNLHITNPELPYGILEIYGKVLNYDFSDHLPDMINYTTTKQKITLEQAIKERDYWKDKYVNLLEKYNILVEEKMK